MFRIKFPTKRIFRIFPTLRTDGMAPFGTYLWNDPRTTTYRETRVMDFWHNAVSGTNLPGRRFVSGLGGHKSRFESRFAFTD